VARTYTPTTQPKNSTTTVSSTTQPVHNGMPTTATHPVSQSGNPVHSEVAARKSALNFPLMVPSAPLQTQIVRRSTHRDLCSQHTLLPLISSSRRMEVLLTLLSMVAGESPLLPYASVSLYHGGSPSKSQHPSYHPLCQSKCTKLTPFFKGIANHLTDTASPASHSRTANPSSHQPAPQPPSTSCRTAIWAAVPTAVSALRAWRGIAKIAYS